MSDLIHPTAVIDPGASLAPDVRVGPLSVIGAGVTIGAGTRVGAHACIEGATTIGADNYLGNHVCLGTPPQDRGYAGEPTRLEIGDGNWLGDGVNINRGTVKGGELTKLGDRNMLMAYVHVGHDCRLGDDITIVNNCLLGGHAEVHDGAQLAGCACMHQFARVGRLAFVRGLSGLSQDTPPFAMVFTDRGWIHGVNRVGMRRAGMSGGEIDAVRKAFKRLFRSGDTVGAGLDALEADMDEAAEGAAYVAELIAFCRASKRGLCRWEPKKR